MAVPIRDPLQVELNSFYLKNYRSVSSYHISVGYNILSIFIQSGIHFTERIFFLFSRKIRSAPLRTVSQSTSEKYNLYDYRYNI